MAPPYQRSWDPATSKDLEVKINLNHMNLQNIEDKTRVFRLPKLKDGFVGAEIISN